MGRKSNKGHTQKIYDRYRALKRRHELGDPSPIETLAAERGVSVSAVRYHLRRADSGHVGNLKYTATELAKIANMNKAELAEYANTKGVTTNTLKQAVYRDRRRTRAKALDVKDKPAREHINFCSPVDLESIGVSVEQIRLLRNKLREEWGLALRSPNYLHHPTTKRKYAMTLREQIALITNTKKFLRARATHIKANWTKSGDIND
jgi:hypothetical protein